VDKDELVVFLESGGNLILSGQNIGDDLGPGDPFLNQYLKADHETDNVSQQFLNGITGNSISNGTSLLLVGSTGASNQTSPASCIPLAGGEAVYRYQNAPNPIGAVSYEDELYQYHSLYFSFGIEAVSGLANTLPLSGLLNNIFTWMGFEMGISPEASVPPLEFSLNSIYPNPFNPTTTISYTIHRPGLTELALYNVLGQKVILLWAGNQPAGNYEIQWSAKDEVASGSSGIYVCRLNFEGQSATKLMLLLK
jgi:hypothetical protein